MLEGKKGGSIILIPDSLLVARSWENNKILVQDYDSTLLQYYKSHNISFEDIHILQQYCLLSMLSELKSMILSVFIISIQFENGQ